MQTNNCINPPSNCCGSNQLTLKVRFSLNVTGSVEFELCSNETYDLNEDNQNRDPSGDDYECLEWTYYANSSFCSWDNTISCN